jgi:hypothetical protein
VTCEEGKARTACGISKSCSFDYSDQSEHSVGPKRIVYCTRSRSLQDARLLLRPRSHVFSFSRRSPSRVASVTTIRTYSSYCISSMNQFIQRLANWLGNVRQVWVRVWIVDCPHSVVAVTSLLALLLILSYILETGSYCQGTCRISHLSTNGAQDTHYPERA